MGRKIKVKFVGKRENLQPEDCLITYFLKKNGYEVELSEDPDYIICDVYGSDLYEYCRYPQVRILETGENYTPDFNLIDYAVSKYPISYFDRNFYVPGCAIPAGHWLALPQKDRNYTREFLKQKKYFCNFIFYHDSENGLRGEIFRKLSKYRRIESPGPFLNNMAEPVALSWADESKTEFQRNCKFTICFDSISQNGFLTEKITDAFFADTIPIYYGSKNVTDFFNPHAFINCMDYDSLDDVVEKIIELDQDDEKYLQMLRQPILVDPSYPARLEKELEQYVCSIFEQAPEQAYRRCRSYYPKMYNDFLAEAIEPTRGYQLKQKLKKLLRSGGAKD